MAEWRGMKVKLNSPSRIQKGEPGYGRKKFKVFVSSNGKVKKVMFGDPYLFFLCHNLLPHLARPISCSCFIFSC